MYGGGMEGACISGKTVPLNRSAILSGAMNQLADHLPDAVNELIHLEWFTDNGVHVF